MLLPVWDVRWCVYEEHVISETESNLDSPKPAQALLANAADEMSFQVK